MGVTAFRTVRGRMLFWILCVVVPIYAAASYMSYHTAAQRLEADAEHQADELVEQLAAGVDSVIRPIEGGIRTIAAQLEEIDPPREQYALRIRGILAAWPEVYGSTIATEGEPFAPYYFRRGGAIAYSDLALDSYGYGNLPWYRNAADTRRAVWSPPYFDSGGGEVWMVTYSVPFFRQTSAGRVLAGVVTADLALNWMKSAAAKVQLAPFAAGWLLSPSGPQALIVPVGATGTRRMLDSGLREETIRSVADDMATSRVTFGPLPERFAHVPTYLAVRNLETLNWKLVLIAPRDALLADARGLLQRHLLLGGVGLLLLIAAISWVASGISRPIQALAQSVGGVRDDNFSFQLPESTRRDEVGVLTEALRRMRDSLQRHIQLRAESLAVQAKLEHELEIAASIQQSMLPRRESVVLPPAARVAAALVPAKRVGGDLYDYFVARDGALLFAIGDVSDKGIPAALFMARLSGLLKVLGMSGEYSDRLLSGINARLVENNSACMFATLGCGLLDVDSGLLRYASAGHEAPLVCEVGGAVAPLDAQNGPAIGIDAGVDYPLIERFLAPGDTLVMFTDGVTEAAAEDGSQFGFDRLVELLSADSFRGDPGLLVPKIVESVTAHAALFHATDDLTVLAVTFAPVGVAVNVTDAGTRWVIDTEPTAAGVATTRRWLTGILSSRGVPPERRGDAELVTEELLTNIVRGTGARGAAQRLSLECLLSPDKIVLTTRDDGPEFNPLEHEAPALEAGIAERGIGGLGIHIVRQLAEQCSYARVDGCNVLEVFLRR